MPDPFEQFRDTIKDGLQSNGKAHTPSAIEDRLEMLLDNQREILACLATIARGGALPITIARDLQDRAKKISKILEG